MLTYTDIWFDLAGSRRMDIGLALVDAYHTATLAQD